MSKRSDGLGKKEGRQKLMQTGRSDKRNEKYRDMEENKK